MPFLWPVIIMKWCSLFSVTLFTLKFTLILKIDNLDFFWLLWAWYIFFHHFSFNLFASLKCVSCKQSIVSSWCVVNLTISAFLIEFLDDLHLIWSLIWLYLPSCYFFQLVLLCSLFHFPCLSHFYGLIEYCVFIISLFMHYLTNINIVLILVSISEAFLGFIHLYLHMFNLSQSKPY